MSMNKTKHFLPALGFGIIFGFLLQKGGVAKYHVLVGSLLLQDFTVFKVMLSAIIVGMIGIFAMNRMGMVKLHLKPFKYVANIIGGLIFGLGFGLAGYCPGTEAAAIGQGNLDALVSASGMVLGSYLYGEMYPKLKQIQNNWNAGTVTLPNLAGVSTSVFIVLFVPLLIGFLVFLETVGGR